ncbi:MAG: 50S ribosomal protein L13 [Candidatus Terrybacteria bacterium RIFCSPLOWO2_01_FULL_44_24]|uniref:Large ribosomal subunit protein uL13 n=1 Tax=Candidatus Terrybacteria bacterium RIFCSPHIGHO2_01_FULL_43_35 TaxID=1802361 RepID=A0A1G2PFF4_9BACT|nr:MAG: 50S ribosomal protein L13 [Candidatus Terrybacteria bacterium RIFCSPHIGHO2_01_FULL_43_35]OHA49943.1 MAG: 50S ribosomal protein L13 [Candidatus Terrybacteria bacterium RIFCSPHIGHO2_02_FULL_43_14]OHA51735.1 MAG: 50S ribosomal protein L13 [Candidatus Terrybacteria bacterium RIFCSPLOWO2_01_FULL_44_24]
MQRKNITIDASGKKVGRLAVQIANILRGKDASNFAPNLDPGVSVSVINVGRMEFSKRKQRSKTYWRHSGYLGGIKFTSAEYLWKKNPNEVLRRAIWGMLPSNRLRARMMRHLEILSGEKNK